MSVLVFCDAYRGTLSKAANEAVNYGKRIADAQGTDVHAVSYGSVGADALAALGAYGAAKVTVARNISEADSQQLTRFVTEQATASGASIVVFSHDFTGKTVAPRVAAAMQAGIVTGAVAEPDASAGFQVRKAVFSGKAFATFNMTTDKKVITLMPNSMSPQKGEGSAEVAEATGDYGAAGVTVKEFRKKGGDGVPLTEAELVVSAGRGLKGPENWGMIEELAGELGAATACSRPVADIGWRPHHEHVGQTGIAIGPNLYIAVGISGAIQHLAGVNRSKTIVVVNTDPEAPFFKAADYGVVGDAFEVVPRLLESVKKFKAQAN